MSGILEPWKLIVITIITGFCVVMGSSILQLVNNTIGDLAYQQSTGIGDNVTNIAFSSYYGWQIFAIICIIGCGVAFIAWAIGREHNEYENNR